MFVAMQLSVVIPGGPASRISSVGAVPRGGDRAGVDIFFRGISRVVSTKR